MTFARISPANPPEQEGKHVTVLAVDVAGLSPLSGRLAGERVWAILDTFTEVLARDVQRYEGTVARRGGEGMIAVFGAPLADEAHAARALRAALAMQASARKYASQVEEELGLSFQIRIGIHSGGVDSRHAAVEGEAIETAVRIQQIAPTGTIWVAANTHQNASQAFDWQDVGAFKLTAGGGPPSQVFQLVGQRPTRSRFEAQARRRLTRFVARVDEPQRLTTLWEAARAGAGQIVSVVGSAGLGKSRLIHEFKAFLERNDGRYLEGSCFAFGDIIPYLPFREILAGLFGITPGTDEAEARRVIDARLHALELGNRNIGAYIHRLFDVADEGGEASTLPGHLVRARTIEALRDLLVAAACKTPCALIFEDMHWIDKTTEQALGCLVEGMSQAPLLVLLVYRPEYLHAWKDRINHSEIALDRFGIASTAEMVRAILDRPYAETLCLRPLSAADSALLASEVLGVAEIPQELQELIMATSEGNPFFVEELILALLEKGTLRKMGRAVVMKGGPAAIAVPSTVQGVLLSRIDRLPDAPKTVLQTAAVIGRVFKRAVLAPVLGMEDTLDPILGQLQDLEFIYQASSEAEPEYSFKHVLAQQAVYEVLPPARRQALHGQIAAVLEALHANRLHEQCELLAHHYLNSGNDERALAYVDLANERAIANASVHEAQRQFDTAMALLDRLPDAEPNRRRRIALLARQGVVLEAFGRMREWYSLLDRFKPIAEALGDDGLLGALYGKLAWLAWYSGDNERGIEIGSKAAPLCEKAGNWEDAAQAYLAWQVSHLARGEYQRALELMAEVRRMTSKRFHVGWHSRAARTCTIAYLHLGNWREAIAVAEEDLAVCDRYSDHNELAHAAMWASQIYLEMGDFERALHYGELAVERSRWPDKRWHQGGLVRAWSHTGQAERSIAVIAHVVAAFRQLGAIPFSEWWAGWLGEAYFLSGRYPEARRALEEHLAIALRHGLPFEAGTAHRRLAETLLASERQGERQSRALFHLRESERLLSAIGAENELALTDLAWGRFHLAARESDQAETRFKRALAVFERLGTRHRALEARKALDAL